MPSESSAPPPPGLPEVVATLRQIETKLGEVQHTLEANVREQRHQEFSLGRLLGSILQALVAGLLLWALVDWLFSEPRDALLVKLAFAAVLQLAALTGFTLGRERD